MMPVQFVPLALGDPAAASFFLLFIFIAVLIITLLGVLSALFDVLVYAGGAALVIGALFYFLDELSLAAAMEFLGTLL